MRGEFQFGNTQISFSGFFEYRKSGGGMCNELPVRLSEGPHSLVKVVFRYGEVE
jgi:hypothetical protein